MVSLFSNILDVAGFALGFWRYPIMILPLLPPMIPVNLVFLPMIYMLMYQYFPKWKSFIFASIGISLLNSFVFEPILVWLELYEPVVWKHIYSLPIYIFMAVFLKWLLESIVKRAQ